MKINRLILAVAIAVALWLVLKNRTQTGEPQVEASPAVEPAPMPSPSLAATLNSKTISHSTPVVAPSSELQAADPAGEYGIHLPNLSETRKEVAQDPHTTPRSLLKFAEQLTPPWEEAKKSPQAAAQFFGVLEQCLQNRGMENSVPIAAQTLCLSSAEDLAKLYPDALTDRLARTKAQLSPQVRKLKDAMDQLR